MPLVLMAPLAAFVIAISSVRTRRASANLTMLGAVVALMATLLVAWGLTRRTAPFRASYPYLNLSSIAFSGPANFQAFGIDIILRVDHITVVALLVAEVCVIGALGWHRVMGRSEPGAARFYALTSLFLFGCAGALVSWDLAELLAFWGLTGGVTYLLLAHRWGVDEPARSARLALALPFATDLFLLCGVAVLYSRYGRQDLDGLIPILHATAGWTVRSLVVASVLLFVGVAGRLALWPLQAWVTGTAVGAPPAASAATQAVWSVLAITVLYRLLPIFVAANPQTLRAGLTMCALAAVVAPLLALFGNEPRRVVALAGSGLAAVGAAVVVHGFENPAFTFATAGLACVYAAAPARVAGVLAASAVAGVMRTDDLAEMGDAWGRMRATASVLVASGVVLGFSAGGALAFAVDSRSQLGAILGEAVLLVSIASLRVFLGSAFGPLRRRRAFEPDRVREVPAPALSWTYWVTLGGGVLTVASLFPAWIGYLDGRRHPAPSAGRFGLWFAVAALGFVFAAFAYALSKDGALRASAGLGAAVGRLLAAGAAALSRFILGPARGIVDGTTERLAEGEGGVGEATLATGRLAGAAARLPALPLIVLLSVLLALILALLSPGVFR